MDGSVVDSKAADSARTSGAGGRDSGAARGSNRQRTDGTTRDMEVGAARVALCILATWLVPGAGHWMLGRRGKAALYFSLITFLFVFGMVIGEFRVLNLEHFWLHFVGQVFYGGLALPVLFATRGLGLETTVDPGGVSLEFPFLDVGVLYTTVAGLLNICVMVDLYETATSTSRGSVHDALQEGAEVSTVETKG